MLRPLHVLLCSFLTTKGTVIISILQQMKQCPPSKSSTFPMTNSGLSFRNFISRIAHLAILEKKELAMFILGTQFLIFFVPVETEMSSPPT